MATVPIIRKNIYGWNIKKKIVLCIHCLHCIYSFLLKRYAHSIFAGGWANVPTQQKKSICARPFDQKLGSSLIFFMCRRLFDQIIWSSFIYFFFWAQQFDQDLGYSWIYFFCLHTTIQQKYMVFFHLFFLYCTTIWPKLRVHIDLFLIFLLEHSTKNYGPHWFIYFIFTQPFDKNVWLGTSVTWPKAVFSKILI